MAGIIHMETDVVRDGGEKIVYTAADFIDLIDRLRRSAGNLSQAWVGPSSANYVSDLDKVINSIQTHSSILDELGRRVLGEVDQWVNADQFNSQSISAGISNRIIAGTPTNNGGSEKAPLLFGFGVILIDGIHYSLGVIKDQWNRTLEASSAIANQAIAKSDLTLDSAFTGILGNPLPGDSETIKLELKGDVSIPGAEVGVPGSFKLAGAKEAALTKKNGKYYLTLTGEGGVGLEEPLLEAKGGVKFGNKKYALGVESSVDAMAKGQVEVEYEFDPQKPGNMTKMAGFMYGLGIANSVAAPLVAPALITMKDNMSGLKMSKGAEAGGDINVNALVKLAGVDGKLSGMQGTELRKNEIGNWERVEQVEMNADVKKSILMDENGMKAEIRIESIKDLTTGRESAKVIVEIKAEEGQTVDVSKLGKYLPDMKKSPIQGFSSSSTEHKGMKIEYKLDAPADTAKEMIQGNDQRGRFETLIKKSKIEVYTTSDVEQGIGVEGKLGAASQKVGIDVEANGMRSSEKKIYPPN